VTEGPWSDAKSLNVSEPGSRGLIYTEYNAARGKNVAAFEVQANVLQTDHFLTHGPFPANCWWKFRMYTTNCDMSMDGGVGRNKWWYPSPTGQYSVSPTEMLWILGTGRTTAYNLYNEQQGISNDPIAPTDGSFYIECNGRAAGGELYYPFSNNTTTIGHNITRQPLPGQTWLDIVIHIDTGSAQGTFEMWAKPVASSTWTKYAEWIGGVTPDFEWPLAEARRMGQQANKIPSTVGTSNEPYTTPYSKWLLDEFAYYASDPR
jgi:hypothetical protein